MSWDAGGRSRKCSGTTEALDALLIYRDDGKPRWLFGLSILVLKAGWWRVVLPLAKDDEISCLAPPYVLVPRRRAAGEPGLADVAFRPKMPGVRVIRVSTGRDTECPLRWRWGASRLVWRQVYWRPLTMAQLPRGGRPRSSAKHRGQLPQVAMLSHDLASWPPQQPAHMRSLMYPSQRSTSRPESSAASPHGAEILWRECHVRTLTEGSNSNVAWAGLSQIAQPINDRLCACEGDSTAYDFIANQELPNEASARSGVLTSRLLSGTGCLLKMARAVSMKSGTNKELG